jgi:hypothetical protein
MGEPVAVIEKASSNHGVIRFETNRSFTGMGHERYDSSTPVVGDRPPDVIARALLETGQVDRVHIYAQTITITLHQGASAEGLKEIIEGIYIHYKPGVRVPDEADFA